MPKQITRPDNRFRTVLWPIMKRMPTYLRLGWNLAREPAIPHRHKLMLYGLAVYQFTPIHWAVTPIPVLGQIDFPILLLLAIRQMVAHCPPEVSARCFARLNLEPTQFADDLAAVLKFGGDMATGACRRVGGEVRFAGRVAGKVGVRSLARLVVAAERPRKHPLPNRTP